MLCIILKKKKHIYVSPCFKNFQPYFIIQIPCWSSYYATSYDSECSFLYWFKDIIFVSVQLQNTILAYSKPGLIKEVYIVVKVFLSNKYFSLARIFNFLPAFSLIVVMWSFHERIVLNSTPNIGVYA